MPGDVVVLSTGTSVRIRETQNTVAGPTIGIVVAVKTYEDPTTTHPYTVMWVVWSHPEALASHAVRGMPAPVSLNTERPDGTVHP